MKGYGLGYVISTISVVLLAVPAWRGASGDPLLLGALILGILLSVAGMIIRWIAHDREKKQQRIRENRRSPDRTGIAMPQQAQPAE